MILKVNNLGIVIKAENDGEETMLGTASVTLPVGILDISIITDHDIEMVRIESSLGQDYCLCDAPDVTLNGSSTYTTAQLLKDGIDLALLNL